MTELHPVSWLDAARTQSQALADRRSANAIPMLRLEGRALRSPLWMARSIAVALVMIVPFAYAWVSHTRGSSATRRLSSAELPAATRVRAIATRSVPVVATEAPKPKRVVVAPAVAGPTSTTSNGEFVEPEGEVIFVRPHVQQAPLFDAKEYKSRGVLVKPGE